jgi:GT2 family glycosyltransferase
MDTERLSVIIPTLRRPRRLWRALEGVAAQAYPALEVVVVNDGGVPVETVVERARGELGLSVAYISLPGNHGPAAALNRGLAVASGTLIAPLGDDDHYLAGHLTRLAAALAAHPEAVLTYDEALIQLEDGGEDDPVPQMAATARLGQPYDAAHFERSYDIITSALLLRRRAIEEVGGLDEGLRVLEDWDLLLRLRTKGTFHFEPGLGVEYSLRAPGGGNVSTVFDDQRRAALDTLSARYGLPPLEPKTFLDVARELGFELKAAPGGTRHAQSGRAS